MKSTKNRIQSLVVTDIKLTTRNFEQILLIGLPLLFLVIFAKSEINRTEISNQIDFAISSALTLGLLAIAFARLAIHLGLDRSLGAIHRFSMTPLSKVEFYSAKMIMALLLFLSQACVLSVAAVLLGWQPVVTFEVFAALLLALVTFSALAFAASAFESPSSSIATVVVFLTLFLSSGIIFDLDTLPRQAEQISKFSPSAALIEILHKSFAAEAFTTQNSWIALLAWALLTPPLAIKLFKWK